MTYLEDAAANSARIVTGAHVDGVITDNGSAIGVSATIGDGALTVQSKAVVLAAGSLNTPAILMRSGLGGAAAGQNLCREVCCWAPVF